jgi:hypothetical protein
MGLQVGSKSAGRSVLLGFFLYPAVENIPGGIIFYRGLQTSHTRAEDWKITLPEALIKPQDQPAITSQCVADVLVLTKLFFTIFTRYFFCLLLLDNFLKNSSFY